MEGTYMKKILLMIVFSLSLILGVQSVSAFDDVDIAAVEVLGVVEGGEYTDDLILTITGGTATLNGVEYISGTVINEIGYHTLVLYELGVETETINFTILPRFTNELEEVVYDSLIIELENEGIITVNGRTVDVDISHHLVGDYDITINGIGGFETSYQVTLKDSLMEYIKVNPMYSDFTIDISKYIAVYYENAKLTEDIEFTELGNYTVRLLYKDGTSEKIDFTYAHSTSRFVDGGVYPNSLLLQKDNATKWYINSSEQKGEMGSRFLTSVGKHKITFYGNNGYKREYWVTITEGDIGLYDGKIYVDFFKLDYSGFKVTLNGVNYKSGVEKTGGGYYQVKIKGANGYENYYQIFIHEEVPFEDVSSLESPQVISESITLDQDFYKIYVNGKEEDNFRFSTSGEYRIVYLGAGGYIDAYTVIYENQHQEVNGMLFYGVFGLAGLVGITYLFLGWRRYRG